MSLSASYSIHAITLSSSWPPYPRIYATDQFISLYYWSSSSSFFGTIKKKRGNGKKKCGSYMIRIILCTDRKIYAVLHHCNFAICKYDSSLSLKLWGYGRFAWTAGAFGSLTNGQALPPCMISILKLSNVRDPLNSFWSFYKI